MARGPAGGLHKSLNESASGCNPAGTILYWRRIDLRSLRFPQRGLSGRLDGRTRTRFLNQAEASRLNPSKRRHVSTYPTPFSHSTNL